MTVRIHIHGRAIVNTLRGHLFSDCGDLEELHAAAARLKAPRTWFQNHPRHPHYDLWYSPLRRALVLFPTASGRALGTAMRKCPPPRFPQHPCEICADPADFESGVPGDEQHHLCKFHSEAWSVFLRQAQNDDRFSSSNPGWKKTWRLLFQEFKAEQGTRQ